MTIFVQHPIAHIARQPDLLNKFDETAAYQEKCVQGALNVTSPEVKAALADIGYELNQVVVFDGLPQHFPTVTGAFTQEMKECTTKGGTCNKLPVWNIEEHGPLDCIGPIPQSSLYRKFIELQRRQYMENGFDMKWYGESWEFVNLFWWQHRSWGRVGLDCTHFIDASGGYQMYKFFFQAMIDETFE
jgi:hypothetical protein